MQEAILLKLGEVVLKGLNRHTFEEKLIKNLKTILGRSGSFTFQKAQSTIFITPSNENADMDAATEAMKRVFGVVSFSRACVTPKDIVEIQKAAVGYLEVSLRNKKTFKVEAKRSDKRFPLKSPDICMEVGGYILDAYPHLQVDVHNPEITVMVEVRDYGAYVHTNAQQGAGGLPVGTGGKASILISGGIDSPVAAWMMAKRGVALTAIHFVSPPYTSERAEMKVIQLLEKVAGYSGEMELLIVPFTEIQELIHEECPEDLFTIIMRRYMMKIAKVLSEQRECRALITGESLAQVASQTLQAIACTDPAACGMPVFRPLIGMDKEEIIRISRRIDTYGLSIQPYEDCCTIFTPKHPRTRPILKYVEQAEAVLAEEDLSQRAVEGVRKIKII